MSREKKNALIKEVNPEWKEMATPKGIVKTQGSWSDQVKRVIEEITRKSKNNRSVTVPCGGPTR